MKRAQSILPAWRRYREARASVFTAFVIQGAILVSGVIVARLLGPENRGHFAFIVLGPLIISQVGHLGLPLALTYYTARSPESQAVLFRRAAKVLIPALAVSLLVHLLVVVTFASSGGKGVLTAALLTIPATAGWMAQFVGLALLQGQQRFGLFNVLRALQVSLYGALAFMLLILGVRDLHLIAAAWSSTLVVSGATALAVAVHKVPVSPAGNHGAPSAATMVSFGLKSLPAQVSPIESFRIDQLVLGFAAGPTILGYYVAAYALTNLPRMVAHSTGMVAYPKVASAMEPATVAVRYLLATVALSGTIVAGLGILSPHLIPFFFGPEYEEGVGISRVLLAAAFLMGLKRVLNDCVRGMGHPDISMKAEVMSWIPLVPGFLLLGHSGPGVAACLAVSAGTGIVLLTAMTLASIRTPVVPGNVAKIGEPA